MGHTGGMAPTVAIVSYRLGHADGVSVEAAKWAGAFRSLGFGVVTVAGSGKADRLLPGLAIDADEPPSAVDVADALTGVDLVVAENVCSLPLNREVSEVVAAALAGRPAILHHHDLPWQRPPYRDVDGFPPTDPAWAHVTVNLVSCTELADRGIEATVVPNCFDVDAPPGRREATRRAVGVAPGERLVLQPTRAIARKNVPAGLRLAERLGATYWLVGPAEDGYQLELDRLLAAATVPVVRRLPGETTVADAYAAADAVVLPSTWEGFGNPSIESVIHRRPLAIGRYPVAREIAAFGFRWFPVDDAAPLDRWLDDPDRDGHLLEANLAIARRHFSLASLERRLARLLDDAGWAR
ncbi:MAG TPA: glycosyltransferase, partial [Acidimicrobiales bacterium]|nr:glycosyltransferase [Acidimicrobiales bacterium]